MEEHPVCSIHKAKMELLLFDSKEQGLNLSWLCRVEILDKSPPSGTLAFPRLSFLFQSHGQVASSQRLLGSAEHPFRFVLWWDILAGGVIQQRQFGVLHKLVLDHEHNLVHHLLKFPQSLNHLPAQCKHLQRLAEECRNFEGQALWLRRDRCNASYIFLLRVWRHDTHCREHIFLGWVFSFPEEMNPCNKLCGQSYIWYRQDFLHQSRWHIPQWCLYPVQCTQFFLLQWGTL